MIDENGLRDTVVSTLESVKTLHVLLSQVLNDLGAIREASIMTDPDFQARYEKKLSSIQDSTRQAALGQIAAVNEMIGLVKSGLAF